MNLRSHFEAAHAKFRETEETSLASSDEAYLRLVADGLEHARAADALVNELSVFSSNEQLDDINPGDLKYLLVPYFLGELIMRQVDHDRRIKHLREGKAHLERFIESLATIGLVTDDEAASLQAGGGTGSGNAMRQREQKIARIKAEREVRAQMDAAAARLAAARGRSTGEDDDADVDDVEKEHAKHWLHVAKFAAAETLASVSQELPMLEEVERLRREKPEALREDAASDERPARPLESVRIPHPSQRTAYEQVIDQVHSGRIPGMHTIELDAWHRQEAQRIAVEHQRKQEQQALRAAAEAERANGPQTAVEEEDELAERAKSMSFDEFKDTHAKGSGNMRGRG
mmetsp:Transcript_13307/g.34661  ORF Transcript_13307/g.34661 Transcript_13307/m.34661 type:complete len:345 (-) Transcript_13307:126-1160(-)